MIMNNNIVMSKKASLVKALYYCALPIAYILVCTFINASILWLVPITLVMSLLYTIPFFGMQNAVKSDDVKSIKPFIISDFLYALLPSWCAVFFISIGVYVFADADSVWLFCIIDFAISIFVAMYFWLSYYVFGVIYKNIKSKLDK